MMARLIDVLVLATTKMLIEPGIVFLFSAYELHQTDDVMHDGPGNVLRGQQIAYTRAFHLDGCPGGAVIAGGIDVCDYAAVDGLAGDGGRVAPWETRFKWPMTVVPKVEAKKLSLMAKC
jgi:hypothetical protein